MLNALVTGLVAASISFTAIPSFTSPSIVYNNTKDPVESSEGFDASGMRHITCLNLTTNKEVTGSSAKIGDDLLITAAHVVEGRSCKDTINNIPVKVVYLNHKQDVAVLKTPVPITGIKYKINCAGFVNGAEYYTAGWAYGEIFMLNHLVASKSESTMDSVIDGEAWPGFRFLKGLLIEGMSGGIVVDLGKNIVGINNLTAKDYNAWSMELKKTALCK